MPLSTKRACDACHRRKIRCAGGQPCGNCGHASLSCTYNAIPRKKGPKGSRAKVITELREKQQPLPAGLHTTKRFSGNPDTQERLCQFIVPRPESVDKQLVYTCIDAFFTHMYPTMPIFDRHQLQGRVKDMDRSINAYCVVVSLCAFVMIQPGLTANDTSSGSVLTTRECLVFGKALFEEAVRARRMGMAIDNPSADAVITAFFLFTCSFGLERHNTAWFYLREATTLAEILGMNDESHYDSSLEMALAIRQRRLFWLLFVTERSIHISTISSRITVSKLTILGRAYALQRHRPLTLHPTIRLPTLHEIPSESTTTSGFVHLVSLFRPFDDALIGLWNQTRTNCTLQSLAHMQKQLVNVLPITMKSTETQEADLRTSQQWLRTVIWRLSVSKGFLSSVSPDVTMRFTYPIDIARDLVRDTSNLSIQSMDIHGIGLVRVNPLVTQLLIRR